MSDTIPPSPPVGAFSPAWRHELAALRGEWWCLLLLGVAQIVLGIAAFSTAFLASIVTVVLFGLLLLIAGIAQVIGAFWAGKWSGFLLHLLVGLLYIVNGYIMVDMPVSSTIALTLLLAAMLIFIGTLRIITALVLRFHHWGWPLINGVVSLVLGVMIYKQWPASGLWVIGLFIGIELIFNGWSWVMLAIGLRAIPKTYA
jgi:uncharacterized membrane protein HdeD (DUF308 family)